MTTSRAVRRLRDVLGEQRDELERSFVTQAVVTALGPGTALTVRLAAAEPGRTQTVPRLRSYDDAKVGDVVQLVGPPGSWVAHGALA